MKEIKLFYWNYDSDEGIESHSAQVAALEEAIQYMESLPGTDGNFLGLELPGGEIVQFMHDENRGLLLDIPDMENGGSYSKTLDREEGLQIIRDMYNGKTPRDIPGLVFESY